MKKLKHNDVNDELLLFEKVTEYNIVSNHKSQKKFDCDMRHYFINLMRAKYTREEIGNVIHKDQSTVTASLKRFDMLYEVDIIFKIKFNKIESDFNDLQ
jgi:hypothetical protein